MDLSPSVSCLDCGAPLAPDIPGVRCPTCLGADLFGDVEVEAGAVRISVGGYELLEELGRGGMGVVYRARHPGLGREAAVKLILSGSLATDWERRRFLSEVSAAAALDHPNIVPVYEAGEEGGQPWFAMRLIHGMSLAAARLKAGSAPMPAREAAGLTRTLALAVQHAHDRGFIHRDLKPANILLDDRGSPHIADFGLARRVDGAEHLTLTGSTVGTPAYMAPEQSEARQPPTTAVDIYSLGAMLYECLTGHPPFRAESLADWLMAIRESEPPAMAGVDRDLDTICRKCLEKDPGRRYRSAQALADDLQRWLDGEPVSARAVSRPERVWRWCRRRPAVAGLAAAVLVLAGGGLGGVLWQWDRANAAARAATAAQGLAETKAKEARRALYAADMNLAQAALRSNNLGRARRLLDAHRPDPGEEDLRGWEWRYLWAQCRSGATAVIRSGGASVWGIFSSVDGQRLVTNEHAGVLLEHDVASRSLVKSHRQGFDHGPVVGSPDGTRFAVPVSASVAEVWRHGSPKIDRFAMTARMVDAAWSADGARLALQGEDGSVRLYDAKTGERRHEWKLRKVNYGHGGGLAFLPGDPLRLAVADIDYIRVFRCEDGAVDREWAAHPGNGIAALAASSDGRWLVSSACYKDTFCRVWDAATGEEAASLQAHASWISSVLFSRDGALLYAAGADQMISVWETSRWELVSTLRGHTDEIWCLALAGDGLASGAKNGEIMLWPGGGGAESAGRFRFPRDTHEVLDAGTSGELIALRAGFVTRWKPGSWHRGNEVPLPAGSMRYTSHGVLFIRGPDSVTRVLDAAADPPSTVAEISIPEMRGIISLPDGSASVLSHDGGKFTLFDRPTGRTTEVQVEGSVRTFGLSPARRHLLLWTTAEDGCHSLQTCELATGRWLLPEPVAEVPVGFRSDWNCRWMARLDGKRITLARAHPFAPLMSIEQENEVPSLAFSMDGRWMAIANEGAWVRLWRLSESGISPDPLILRGHLNSVHSLCFTPDSSRLATLCSNREAAKLWDPVTGHEMLTLSGDAAMLYYARFSADGTTLLASRPGQGNPWDAWHAPSLEAVAEAEKSTRW